MAAERSELTENMEVANNVDASCLELGMEAQRLFDSGNCDLALKFFDLALQVGTDNPQLLSAIYNQMGNAYFYLRNYSKALEYHKLDLGLSRSMADKLGEAKASSNLGNTLKVLTQFDDAVICCRRHLDIAREVGDRVSEARALYNLGNIYHVKGKHCNRTGNQEPFHFTTDVREAFEMAAKYYDENLAIAKELGDRASQGRTYGNLGNTHYLLGNFHDAIRCHSERLSIAKEFGDRAAERRAFSNLGNVYSFLSEWKMAIKSYKNALQIAQLEGERALEAQCCYSLGAAYTLMGDYPNAVDFHLRHLDIAQQLADLVGEGRACWSLANAYNAMRNYATAMHYANKHLQISEEIGDENGKATALIALGEVQRNMQVYGVTGGREDVTNPPGGSHPDLVLITNNQQTPTSIRSHPHSEKANSIGGSMGSVVPQNTTTAAVLAAFGSKSSFGSSTGVNVQQISAELTEEDDFFSLLSKYQSRRMDEQRCSFRFLDNQDSPPGGAVGGAGGVGVLPSSQDAFLDLVAGVQGRRMNDQRATPPSFPGLKTTPAVLEMMEGSNKENRVPDDAFFEMLMRCQATRIDDQRSSLPDPLLFKSPTVPDEDFFTRLMRLQSPRLDEQRCDPLTALPTDAVSPDLPPAFQLLSDPSVVLPNPPSPLDPPADSVNVLQPSQSPSNHQLSTGGDNSTPTSRGVSPVPLQMQDESLPVGDATSGGGFKFFKKRSSKKNKSK